MADDPPAVHPDFTFMDRIRAAEAQAGEFVRTASQAASVSIQAAQDAAALLIDRTRHEEAERRNEALREIERKSVEERARSAAAAEAEAEEIRSTAGMRVEDAARAVAERMQEIHARR